MPEGYTHKLTGDKALIRAHITIPNMVAFSAGTQGPDPLFFYRIWKKNPSPNLNKLGSKMHKEKTGAFLTALVDNADTPLLQSYALGFLTHYATDKNAHPYVAFLTEGKSSPYGMSEGHGFYEIALDSELYESNYRSRYVPLKHSTIIPKNEDLNAISELLKAAIEKVYNEKIPLNAIQQCFLDMRFVRGALRSRFGIMRAICRFAEKYVVKKDGFLLSHLTPAKKLKTLPNEWINRFNSSKKVVGGIKEILEKAVIEGAEFIKVANKFWEREISLLEFSRVIESRSYETNLEI